MVMSYLKKRAEGATGEQSLDRPHWASEKNASLEAWKYVERLKQEKARYIKFHHKSTDYHTQKTYQIKGAEVARALKISRVSLMNTSNYSCHFKKYLDSVNAELIAAKEARLRKVSKLASRGSIRNNKDELVRVNKELRKRVDQLSTQKTEELVRYAFDQLPLPVKRKLKID